MPLSLDVISQEFPPLPSKVKPIWQADRQSHFWMRLQDEVSLASLLFGELLLPI
jgi:hypothetical protein